MISHVNQLNDVVPASPKAIRATELPRLATDSVYLMVAHLHAFDPDSDIAARICRNTSEQGDMPIWNFYVFDI
jgi:hypothetical protein